MQISTVSLDNLFPAVIKGNASGTTGADSFSKSLQEQETVRSRGEESRLKSSSSRNKSSSVDSSRDQDASPAKKASAKTDGSDRADEPTRVTDQQTMRDSEDSTPPAASEKEPAVSQEVQGTKKVADVDSDEISVAAEPIAAGAVVEVVPELSAVTAVPDEASESPVVSASVAGSEVFEAVESFEAESVEVSPLSAATAAQVADSGSASQPLAADKSVSFESKGPAAVIATAAAASESAASAGKTVQPELVSSVDAPPSIETGVSPGQGKSLAGLTADQRFSVDSVQVRAAQASSAQNPDPSVLAKANNATALPAASDSESVAQVLATPGTVVAAAATQVAPTTGLAKKTVLAAGESLGEASDKRFAQLLGGNDYSFKGQSLRSTVAQVAAENGEATVSLDARQPGAGFAALAGDIDGGDLLADGAPVEGFPGLNTSTSQSPSLSVLAGSVTAPQAVAPASAAPVLQTTVSSLSITEDKVVDQVIGKLTLNQTEGKSSITMNLNPEELGRVRLEMSVEGDRVRAQFHAQSQQVQEVLEKHLPRLRDALESQGLKLDEVRVDADASQQQGGKGFYQDQRQQASSFHATSRGGVAASLSDQAETGTSYRPPLHQGGISLRV